jgi:hypothetical protein
MHRAPRRSIFPSVFCHLLHYNLAASLAPDLSTTQAMAMSMADEYYAGDLEDVVHRLLPREILADVGIVVPECAAPPSSCAVTRRRGDDHAAAVMEDLAAHLVGILGLDAAREQQRAPRPHLQHHRAGMGHGSRAPVGGGHGGAARHAPPASCWNGAAPHVPGYAMVADMNSHPPAMRQGAGTGVFLPRVEAYGQNRASSTSPSPRNGKNCLLPPCVSCISFPAIRQTEAEGACFHDLVSLN